MKFNKKLKLNKVVIASLDAKQLNIINGGGKNKTYTCPASNTCICSWTCGTYIPPCNEK